MERFHEKYALVATIDPTGDATGTSTSDTIDMIDVSEVVFVLMTETVAATGTVDLTVQSGTATGTITTSVTAITQLTAADDDKQVIVSVLADALGEGHRYVNAKLEQGTANSECAVVAFAKQKYAPANEHDLASVDEIVVKG